ncbi:MAG: histidine kinase [Opitutae bacterium]|nr:histidine kinase [Opitutae bacterium]
MPRPSRFTQIPVFARLSLFWQLQLAGWGAFAVLALPLKQLAFGSMRAAVLISVFQFPLSLALSAALRRFYLRVAPAGQTFGRAALLVWVACAGVCTIDTGISIPLTRQFGIATRSDLVEPAMYFFRFAVYFGWSLAYLLIKTQRQTREQAFQTAVAEERHRFELLRYQLNPGFLAKSLAAIAQEMNENVAAAHAMTLRLADFYQGALRQTARERPATIGDEVALLRTYLELERLRQHGALLARFAVDESLLDLPLPPILLLPIAEKAVKSGHGTVEEPLEVSVTIQCNPDGLVAFEIARTRRTRGSRQPFAEASPEVADVRANLERYYPGRYRFNVSRDSLRECTTLCLPLAR